IISTRVFTPEQHNSSCAPCHAKMQPLTKSYIPGEPYFDNFNLSTFEDPDFYPDGRDLGENYTLTGWQMNKCMIEGDLHCVSCHTSSGRTRFTDDQSNQLCLPCHQEKVQNVVAHSAHSENSEGSKCINCHLPKREFVGHFIRSDHSFRPPIPEATIKFGSPNACNNCHSDKSPEWADKIVKQRKNRDYQVETVLWGQLIKEAREDNWKNIDKIYSIIKNDKYGEVVTNSFIRLLSGYNNESKQEVLTVALRNNSPLVRASAASGLSVFINEKAKYALLSALTDDFRIVRIAAAFSLSAFPPENIPTTQKELLEKATDEYKQSLLARPDDWSAYYNLGIFYQNKGDLASALNSYETSAGLYSNAVLPLINSSVLYSYTGNQEKAEENLKKAVQVDPENEAANLNLGLLMAEMGKTNEAITALLKALEVNPKQAVAAYNLSVLLANENIDESIHYAKIAHSAEPENTRYGYTLAFFQNQAGKTNDAIATLKENIDKQPVDLNSIFLLGEIYLKMEKKEDAVILYKKILKNQDLPAQDRERIQQVLSQINAV
ncbi:MAG: ammonia-forming cytochrome c nitrite reductase subunit c552, partial [Prolixibacteraceae bacterium]|nr:ammonia-forming cytochrome c nitrite reductase subunit c552 [Prolixibacteraceae bacterium]MBN2773401.1 ammonia-forming cytochrome c nitrite reductase subunit c552 [Prolixibacteraceae bacterium]